MADRAPSVHICLVFTISLTEIHVGDFNTDEFFSFSLCSLEEGHRQRWSWRVHSAQLYVWQRLQYFRALHPNMLPSHSWSCFTAEPLGIIRVAPEVNHVDFSQQSFERSRKFLLLWELSSLAQLTGAGPSSCVHTTTTPSQWPHQVGLESGMRHNQYLPWKFLIATKTALLSLGGSLG